MIQPRWFLSVTLLVALVCSGADGYDFRSPDRPRYERSISVTELRKMKAAQAVTLLDVRLLEDFAEDQSLIPGASYKNPDDIALWSAELAADVSIVVYCVKGKWVSQKAAKYLAEAGYDVLTLDGGIEAWKRSPTQ